MLKTNDPHVKAASLYAGHAIATTPDAREIEARALLKAAEKMRDVQARWPDIGAKDLEEVLCHNRQIWMIFFDAATSESENITPQLLRYQVTQLAAYIFKRTLDILAYPQPEKFDVLIDINHEIAAGLMASQKEGV